MGGGARSPKPVRPPHYSDGTTRWPASRPSSHSPHRLRPEGEARCSPPFTPRRCSASMDTQSLSKFTCRSACLASRSSDCPTRRAARRADRVRAAILSSGLAWPNQRITVNLAPSGLRKAGSGLDLAIAIGVLVASESLAAVDAGMAFLGELGLDGAIRPVPGAVPMVDAPAGGGHGRPGRFGGRSCAGRSPPGATSGDPGRGDRCGARGCAVA